MIHIDKNHDNYVIASFASPVKKLDILVADKIKGLLQEVMAEGKPYLILDLEKILYIDSSGFGAIISLNNYAKNKDIGFILCNISEANMALVKITKLHDILKIYKDRSSAVDAMKK